MNTNDADNGEQRRRIRRSALILIGIALTFYVGFILSGVLRA